MLLLVFQTVQAQINDADIVTEIKYSTSDYYQVVDNFLTGMNATKRYTREPACQASFTQLMDRFYDLEKNRTGAVAKPGDSVSEGTLMYISKVVSVEYRDTIRNCFGMTLQIYAKTKKDWSSFPSDEERFISFLFNMLEHSF